MRRAGIRTIRRWLRVSVAVTDPVELFMAVIRAEFTQGIIQPEHIRAFIHPVVVVYRSQDEVAEADEIHRLRREQGNGEVPQEAR